MVSYVLLILGLLLIGGGVFFLLMLNRKPDVWIWVGQGDDPFRQI